MLVHKGLDNVQHWGEMEVIGLCMVDFVKNLQNSPNMRELYSNTVCGELMSNS